MNHFRVIALVVATSLFAPSQAAETMPQQGSAVEQEVRQLDREWLEAMVRRDATALERLLADAYTMIDPSGEVIDKAQEIAATKAPVFDVTFESVKTEDVNVGISGERATVTGRAVLKARFDEQEISQRYWYTRTFAKRQGGWLIITAQMTYLPAGE